MYYQHLPNRLLFILLCLASSPRLRASEIVTGGSCWFFIEIFLYSLAEVRFRREQQLSSTTAFLPTSANSIITPLEHHHAYPKYSPPLSPPFDSRSGAGFQAIPRGSSLASNVPSQLGATESISSCSLLTNLHAFIRCLTTLAVSEPLAAATNSHLTNSTFISIMSSNCLSTPREADSSTPSSLPPGMFSAEPLAPRHQYSPLNALSHLGIQTCQHQQAGSSFRRNPPTVSPISNHFPAWLRKPRDEHCSSASLTAGSSSGQTDSLSFISTTTSNSSSSSTGTNSPCTTTPSAVNAFAGATSLAGGIYELPCTCSSTNGINKETGTLEALAGFYSSKFINDTLAFFLLDLLGLMEKGLVLQHIAEYCRAVNAQIALLSTPLLSCTLPNCHSPTDESHHPGGTKNGSSFIIPTTHLGFFCRPPAALDSIPPVNDSLIHSHQMTVARCLVNRKLNLLRIVSSYDHLVPISLPLLFSASSIGCEIDSRLSDAGSTAPGDSVVIPHEADGEPLISRDDALQTTGEPVNCRDFNWSLLTHPTYRATHFIIAMVLSELKLCLDTSDQLLQNQAMLLVWHLLCSHECDPRLTGADSTLLQLQPPAGRTQMIKPFALQLGRNLKCIPKAQSEKRPRSSWSVNSPNALSLVAQLYLPLLDIVCDLAPSICDTWAAKRIPRCPYHHQSQHHNRCTPYHNQNQVHQVPTDPSYLSSGVCTDIGSCSGNSITVPSASGQTNFHQSMPGQDPASIGIHASATTTSMSTTVMGLGLAKRLPW
ncbi:unnamed protein product [Protopolystoma xenopodis]|uniref:Uncharacterized protein n=1 Tax=Protopolystoma xenopodis TaxID=117903 RepID=A0A3S5CT03_9PLAT|nr:unnamed protein product [Protopolystoma xenopodis]